MLYAAVLSAAMLSWAGVTAQTLGTVEIVYEWAVIDYDWPTPQDRQNAINEGRYIPENNVITGIKTYQDGVYVTVSRWLKGVPSAMNKVEMKDGKPVLKPYPDWEWQNETDCSKFQFTQSMEIDPTTGFMWIIDTGRLYIWDSESQVNNCPPELLIWDMINNRLVARHVFSDQVFSYTRNFVNDLVVDQINGYVYMSDVGHGPTGHHGGVVVLNINNNKAHRLEHPSMHYEPENMNVTINGKIYPQAVPVDGIALSPDRTQLYYCPLGGLHLYQLPTAVANIPGNDIHPHVRPLGAKKSQTDGMLMGRKGLYYGALSLNAVYAWEYAADMQSQNRPLSTVEMKTITRLDQNNVTMIWADTFAMDNNGWLWTTPNRLPLFRNRELDFTGNSGANFRITRIYVDDVSYIVPV